MEQFEVAFLPCTHDSPFSKVGKSVKYGIGLVLKHLSLDPGRFWVIVSFYCKAYTEFVSPTFQSFHFDLSSAVLYSLYKELFLGKLSVCAQYLELPAC